MKDFLTYAFILAIAFLVYFVIVMPIRVKICETQNMTAVWYINGCVIKEK